MPHIRPIDPDTPDQGLLREAAMIASKGGILVYPTETLYGFGTNAFNARAIARLKALKGREGGKGIIVLLGSGVELSEVASDVPETARRLMAEFWPGPLTLVVRARQAVPDELTGGRGTIAVRISPSAVCESLLRFAGCPLTSTSVNLAGGDPLVEVPRMVEVFGDGVDLYLDAGRLESPLPSTVVDVTGPVPRLLRRGAVTAERLRDVLPDIVE